MKTSNFLSKTLNWIVWISAIVGVLFILLALFQIAWGTIPNLFMIPGIKKDARLFGDTEIVNFFIASMSFFAITIVVFLYEIKNQLKKE